MLPKNVNVIVSMETRDYDKHDNIMIMNIRRRCIELV